jgi:hypothetical protein
VLTLETLNIQINIYIIHLLLSSERGVILAVVAKETKRLDLWPVS